MSEGSEYLKEGRLYKFVLEVRVKDIFLKLPDVLEFIKYRINLKYCCGVEKIYAVEDPVNPCQLVNGGK